MSAPATYQRFADTLTGLARETTADAWRHSLVKADNSWRAIKMHRKTLERPDECLSTGMRCHSEEYVQHARQMLPVHEANLIEAALQVFQCEAAMDAAGIVYVQSRDEWRDDPLTIAAMLCESLGAV